MKILVTGAAGFIGSHVAQRLLQRGDEVIGLDNFAPNYSRARKEANLKEYAAHERFTFIEADIRDAQAMRDLFEAQKFDRVMHLAAMGNVRYSVEHAPEYTAVNIGGTVNLLEAARLSGTRYLRFRVDFIGLWQRAHSLCRDRNGGASVSPLPRDQDRLRSDGAHVSCGLRDEVHGPALLQRLWPARPARHDAVRIYAQNLGGRDAAHFR